MSKRYGGWFGLLVGAWLLGSSAWGAPPTKPGFTPSGASRSAKVSVALELAGRTQAVPARLAWIAPAVAAPVVAVRVQLGERVTKGQVLVQLDDRAAQADLRLRETTVAELTTALKRVQGDMRLQEVQEAQALLDASRARVSAEKSKGSATQALAKAQADEQAALQKLEGLVRSPSLLAVAELQARLGTAKAAVAAAQAELERYQITAACEGVVDALTAQAGSVLAPGQGTWGMLLDLRELDVRCEVGLELAETLKPGQKAEVRQGALEPLPGQVVWVGATADPRTGKLPLLIRLANPGERLRCQVDVKVAILEGVAAPAPK